jgi:hypothetical protein
MRTVLSNSSLTIGTMLGAALLAFGLSACTPPAGSPPAASIGLPTAGSTTASAATTSAPKENSSAVVDYSSLLIHPSDINSDTDTFVNRTTTPNRRGNGISALFVNQDDTRAVGITIRITPDAQQAASALAASVGAIGSSVVGGQPQASPVGAGGTMISGRAPDGSKDVTVLLFTEGPAVVRMEFGSVPGSPAPTDVVNDIGTKQDIALRAGLPKQAG